VRAFLSLGSNLGDRAANLRIGVAAVVAGDAYRLSPLYETEPVGGVEQDRFWNLVVELETDASPRELLARCQAAETEAKRVRTVRWGPRTLDADVLLVGDLVVSDEDLEVPHPRMRERRFVLQPLADLAPELVDGPELAAADGEVTRLGMLSMFH
jgi:2-amino-4-hydroxy-6-hydroxymethyldihydropteridine diphosphokinase